MSVNWAEEPYRSSPGVKDILQRLTWPSSLVKSSSLCLLLRFSMAALTTFFSPLGHVIARYKPRESTVGLGGGCKLRSARRGLRWA